MKTIRAACIKRIIELDSIQEMYRYIGKLRKKKIPHYCIEYKVREDGSVLLEINTAYNNSPLIED